MHILYRKHFYYKGDNLKITFLYDRCCLGGSESAIKNRMDHLSESNIDCEAIFLNPGVEKQTFKNYKTYVAESDLKIKLLTLDSDIIDVLSPISSTFRKVYKTQKTIIHECHASSFLSYLYSLDSRFVKAIVFPSNYVMMSAKKYLKNSIPSFVVYNCLGKDFTKINSYKAFQNNMKIILWIGRIEHNKNWPLLIEIAKHLKNNYVIRVITNSSVSLEYLKFIREINKNNLKGKFDIVNDCPYSEMPKHYYDAGLNGCYLSTSFSESFGMTLLESMYCNCPMVLSDIPVFHEIAKDSALYFSNNDALNCLSSIEKICNDSNLKSYMTSKALSIYNSTYDSQLSINDFINIINKVYL